MAEGVVTLVEARRGEILSFLQELVRLRSVNGRDTEAAVARRIAADNKAGIACGLYALALLHDHRLLDPAAARVILAGVVDEESGASSPLGVRYLLDAGYLPVQGAIYTYAGDVICVGHRGLLRLQLRAWWTFALCWGNRPMPRWRRCRRSLVTK